ncbi:MAG: hypothetical protein RLZZ577_1643 [Bacteroidota bacterium]|jgi:predicted phosphoribosyltransferase
MSNSADIQRSIDSAIQSRKDWNAELLTLNKKLVDAKLSQRASIKKAIKNAEDQIKDLDKAINRMSNDLVKVSRTELKTQDDVILAEQGIVKGTQIIDSIGKAATNVTQSIMGTAPVAEGGLPTTQRGLFDRKQDQDKSKQTMMYVYIGAALLLIMMLFNKK